MTRSFRACTLLLLAFCACGPSPVANEGGTNTDATTTMQGADPRGGDATFSFSWRINGVDPTDASDPCTTASVRFLRMVVVDPNMTEHQYDDFRFDCRLGSYRSPSPALREGRYRIYWEAINTGGQRVSLAAGNYVNGVLTPTLETLEVVRGVHVDFDANNRPDTTFPGAPTNFSTGTGALHVDLGFADTNGASVSCTQAGVASASWTLRLSNGVAIDTHSERTPCGAALAALEWPRVNLDRYQLDVQGFDSNGRAMWNTRCGNLLVTAGASNATHRCAVTRGAR